MNSPAQNSTRSPRPFPDWPARLRADDSLAPAQCESFRLTITRFLAFCRERSAAPTVAGARTFVELTHLKEAPSPGRVQDWKAALNWYFRQARAAGVPEIPGIPTLGKTDLGRTPWEQALIAGIRERHLAWRTEQTYRGWMWRFVRFLGKRGVADAGAPEIKDFLSHLAVKERLGAAAQKQALHPVR